MGKILNVCVIVLMGCLFLFSGCTSDKKNETSNDNLLNEVFENKPLTSGSRELLPTLEDFEIGWVIESNEVKDINKYPEKDKKRLISRGFIEGHVVTFSKGDFNLGDAGEYVSLRFSVSLYDKEKVHLVLTDGKELVNKGYYEYVDEEGNNISIKINGLKNPNLGDESLMYVLKEDAFIGDVSEYDIDFIKNNVYVKVACRSMNSQNCLNLVVEQAKIIESKI